MIDPNTSYYDEKYLTKLAEEEDLRKKIDNDIRITFFEEVMNKLNSEKEFKECMEKYFTKELLESAERIYISKKI